ncbi:cellulase family glycosylhydrolase [Parvibaculum sp.]|uniref:glycoside hydrolase family 5 protein n=1 Tax=Parvibaculum sp. TaxID=2024848 RepID=UPI0025DFE1B9|nr:cellulase family glycosylhydrolase [Parvibaculum sp.]
MTAVPDMNSPIETKLKPLARLRIEGDRFIDEQGRQVILRGVNLGGDSKMPYPGGGTHHPTDFSDHETVSFIGRPFPLDEADEHFSRLAAWGFNCVRLLTTWEAVEHAGPGLFDEAYLDYFAAICARAGDYGLYVFIDFHQDVWSRMSGGDGAPGWLFEKVGLDFTRFHAAGAAHVMQHKYDFRRGGRQAENYPMMSWAQNYRFPVNGIMWTFFFAGRDFAPDLMIDGMNVQDYLQRHYLESVAAVAKRVSHLQNVIGFDSLNEPSSGFIGIEMSYRHVGRTAERPAPVRPGLAWSPLDGLAVSRGVAREIPDLGFSVAEKSVVPLRNVIANTAHTSIWRDGAIDPFEKAGAYRVSHNGDVEVLREDFFQTVGGRRVDVARDYMAPFFKEMARTIRAQAIDWLLFVELDPFAVMRGHSFPDDTPENAVNASHWYDFVTLSTKRFGYPLYLNPYSGSTLEGREIEKSYVEQLTLVRDASHNLNARRGAPTLVGECGIPFDLDNGEAYAAFHAGDHSDAPWRKHIVALDFMYNAFDALLLNSTQWNYSASNRNDPAIGDGWNQEDLSIFSRDQQLDPDDIDSGGRALVGFVRPYVRKAGGTLRRVSFDRESGVFLAEIEARANVASEIFLPRRQYPQGFRIEADGARIVHDDTRQLVEITAGQSGLLAIRISRR